MKRIDNKLNEIFDLEIIPSKSTDLVPTVSNTQEDDDLNNAKQVHRDLINKSQDALDNLLEFAKASESPRAYEVVSNLIKVTSEVAKTLVEIDKKDKKDKPEVQNNTQNNVFVTTTADLQKLIKGEKIDV